MPRRGATSGLQTPNAVNVPDGGATEVSDLRRAEVRDVLRAPEVDSREVEDRGYQQGFASSTAVYRRRIALGILLRAFFLP